MATSGGDQRTPEARPRPRPGRGLARSYLVAALVLIAILAISLSLDSWLRARARRAPLDFLPTSTRLALSVDLRPDSAAMRSMRMVWSGSDVAHLAGRATELSQKLVDWTGLKLDLRRDASSWFGGEVVAGAVGGETGMPLGPQSTAAGSRRPPSLVLIARITSARRARASLDRAVAPMARDLDWRKSVLRDAGGRITVWREASGQEQIAYATQHECLVVGITSAPVAECLLAARQPDRRLAAVDGFRRATVRLLPDSAIWCYLDLASASQMTRYLLPALRHGWLGLVGAYLEGEIGFGSQESAPGTAGALAVALAPQRDGLRVRGVYASPKPGEAGASPHLEKLTRLLPRDTIAYLASHRPIALLPLVGRLPPRLLTPPPRNPTKRWRPFPPLGPWLGPNALPKDILIALLPRPGERRLAMVLAAPSGQMTGARGWLAAALMRGDAPRTTIGDYSVIASDEEAIRQCQLAAKDSSQRLSPPRGRDCQFEVWVRPGRLSHALARFEEAQIRGWEAAGGGEGELSLKAEPRRLLGGP